MPELPSPEAIQFIVRAATDGILMTDKNGCLELVNPAWLRLAFYHLIHNAIVYSHAGNAVNLRVRREGDSVAFSVDDRGIGIAEDELEPGFNRLFRSRDPQVRALPGGGLGLTLVRAIAQRQGGSITATSRVGEGSVFAMTLPAGSNKR